MENYFSAVVMMSFDKNCILVQYFNNSDDMNNFIEEQRGKCRYMKIIESDDPKLFSIKIADALAEYHDICSSNTIKNSEEKACDLIKEVATNLDEIKNNSELRCKYIRKVERAIEDLLASRK
jgi:hypothetical protein